jgi:hypothetical protein
MKASLIFAGISRYLSLKFIRILLTVTVEMSIQLQYSSRVACYVPITSNIRMMITWSITDAENRKKSAYRWRKIHR